MAEENTNTPPEIIQAKTKSSMFNPKILMIGLPIFIVQLVAVYFITANVLLTGGHTIAQKEADKTGETKEESNNGHSGEAENKNAEGNTGGLIFSVDDMIVNPAQTNGKMLLLASLGLSVETEEAKKTLEEKQVIVKDAIISVLSSKNTTQLGSSTYRDTLKTEILKNLAVQMPGSKVNNIYFSKFIIQ
ncbi:MAG: flagellar basal body-associated FliL family protein [Ignavibacteriales bacterium]|nr:flagellar basal body-associated FliL family protein [Ignavibacteriales bacterium]